MRHTEEALRESEEARTRAETGERRAAFLAEAGEILSASLDYRTTLASLARLAVPRIADYCMLFEADAKRVLSLVAFSHVDPAKETVLRRVGEVYRIQPDDSRSLIAEVLRSEGPATYEVEELTDRARMFDAEPELMSLYRQLAPKSYMVLPLVVRGEVLGVLSLAMSESGRSYGREDKELGMELARRAAVAIDNARLYEEAQAANRAKDRFLATLSHELRTPLTPVLAVISRLERRAGLGEEEREALAMIRRNVELEARLIDDLLDLTRVMHGKVDLRSRVLDVRQILSQSLDTCCPPDVVRDRRIAADLAAGEHRVWGDAPRLTQVFSNLLHNAAKFTPPGGSITVRSRNEGSWSDPAGRWLIVEVADDGAGIEPEVLPRIFDAFEQGPEPRRSGGLGLGLAIGKALVELHGGRLTADSAGRDRGTVFTVRLPIGREIEREESMALESERGTQTGAERPLRVLLAEDHADTALALAALLEISGHQVMVAGSVAEALAHAEAVYGRGDAFDLLVSDLGLPDGTGHVLMRELSVRYGLRGIALSGYGMEEDIRDSNSAGFAMHLTKPVDLRDLQDAIRQSVG
ncbi:MAG TPA: ATP-binding protein [Thermoanaerobaculia bacterium]|nr:ATP-binding protein [Thermoanaerobaculia bacterium]